MAENAYGVPASRVLLKDGFLDSLGAADDLCKAAGMSLDDLALVAVKSPATMTDNDRAPGRRAYGHPEEGRSARRCRAGSREPHHVPDHPDAQDRLIAAEACRRGAGVRVL